MRNQRLAPTTSPSPKSNTMQQEQHLSGAYIRSLVKHLSSSSTRRSKDHHHITAMGTKPCSQTQQQQQQQQQAAPQTTPPAPPKKQVRRRLHTSRPYQERLLNMAEARREIVTALRIHRASMRQVKEQQQKLMQQLQDQQDVQVVQEQVRVAWSAPMSSYCLSFSDYSHSSSPSAQFTATSSSCSYYSSPQLPYHTPVAAPMIPMVDDALDHLIPLPAQPLGLNLSFHGFGGVVGGEDDKDAPTGSFDPPPLLQPSPAPSYSVYSSPPPATTMANHDVSSAVTAAAAENTSLHRVLDEEEMAAICSVGERHDIEWSDTVNLVTSVWWSKILESVEGGGGSVAAQQRGDSSNGEDALTDEYYGEDVSLPRMDIGEIQGWDSEWFL